MEDFDSGDGTCKYLRKNLCTVFEQRPNICRTEYMFRKYYSKTMTYAEFETKSLDACMQIKALFHTKEKEPNNG